MAHYCSDCSLRFYGDRCPSCGHTDEGVLEQNFELLEASIKKALSIMCPNPPEPWPDYASAASVLRMGLKSVGRS